MVKLPSAVKIIIICSILLLMNSAIDADDQASLIISCAEGNLNACSMINSSQINSVVLKTVFDNIISQAQSPASPSLSNLANNTQLASILALFDQMASQLGEILVGGIANLNNLAKNETESMNAMLNGMINNMINQNPQLSALAAMGAAMENMPSLAMSLNNINTGPYITQLAALINNLNASGTDALAYLNNLNILLNKNNTDALASLLGILSGLVGANLNMNSNNIPNFITTTLPGNVNGSLNNSNSMVSNLILTTLAGNINSSLNNSNNLIPNLNSTTNTNTNNFNELLNNINKLTPNVNLTNILSNINNGVNNLIPNLPNIMSNINNGVNSLIPNLGNSLNGAFGAINNILNKNG